MSSPLNRHLRYMPFVDGLRAVAVALVVLHHYGFGCSGGYIGVDIFFVVSGYLITGIILRDFSANSFSMLAFWERRVRRIFPALAVVTLACLGSGFLILFPLEYQKLGQSSVALVLMSANVHFWRQIGYFDTDAALKPLLHTWSLAVEEQFYVIFPLILVLLKRLSLGLRAVAVFAAASALFALNIYGSYRHPSANYYLLPTRAWEMLIGAFLAFDVIKAPSARWVRESASGLALAGIGLSTLLYNPATRFPGAAALLPCVSTFLLLWTNERDLTLVGRLLALRAVVFVGLISYSLYLWHWPIVSLAKYYALYALNLPAGGALSPGVRLGGIGASLVLAALTWRWVEVPIRRRIIFKSSAALILSAGGLATFILMGGLYISFSGGVPSRVPEASLHYADVAEDVAVETSRVMRLGLNEALNGSFFPLGKNEPRGPVDFFVWGDSHASVLLPVIDQVADARSLQGQASVRSATAPLLGYEVTAETSLKSLSIPFNDAVLSYIVQNRIQNVVLIACWSGYVQRDGGIERVKHCLGDTVQALTSAGARIWLVREVPKHSRNIPTALAAAVFFGRDPEKIGLTLSAHRDAYTTLNPLFSDLENYTNVVMVDPTMHLVEHSNRCRVAKSGRSLYFDDQHLTLLGANELGPLFEGVFDEFRRP